MLTSAAASSKESSSSPSEKKKKTSKSSSDTITNTNTTTNTKKKKGEKERQQKIKEYWKDRRKVACQENDPMCLDIMRTPMKSFDEMEEEEQELNALAPEFMDGDVVLGKVNDVPSFPVFKGEILNAPEETLNVVEFTFSWCRPCKKFAAKYDMFAEYYDKVRFFKVVGDSDPVLATTAKISEGLNSEKAFDGMISVCSFFTDDDKMVARSVFKDMDSLKGSSEAQAKVMGGFKEHMAGPPTPLMGNLFWTLKGDAPPVAKPATRVTIVPLKPGSQQEVKAGLDKVNEIMKGSPVMGKMIEVGAFFTDDDKVVIRSVFVDTEAMEAGAEAAKKALGIVKDSFAGPPEVIKGVVEWDHQHGKAAPTPPPKKAAVAVASVAMGDSDYKEKMTAIYAAKTKPPWIKEPNAEKYSIEAVQARATRWGSSLSPPSA